MAQKERKKDLEKYFLAHIQILVKCFDLISLCPAHLIWIIDINTSNWISGTPTTNRGRGVRRRLPPLWMRTPRQTPDNPPNARISAFTTPYSAARSGRIAATRVRNK